MKGSVDVPELIAYYKQLSHAKLFDVLRSHTRKQLGQLSHAWDSKDAAVTSLFRAAMVALLGKAAPLADKSAAVRDAESAGVAPAAIAQMRKLFGVAEGESPKSETSREGPLSKTPPAHRGALRAGRILGYVLGRDGDIAALSAEIDGVTRELAVRSPVLRAALDVIDLGRPGVRIEAAAGEVRSLAWMAEPVAPSP